jgi:hypothetical protein
MRHIKITVPAFTEDQATDEMFSYLAGNQTLISNCTIRQIACAYASPAAHSLPITQLAQGQEVSVDELIRAIKVDIREMCNEVHHSLWIFLMWAECILRTPEQSTQPDYVSDPNQGWRNN